MTREEAARAFAEKMGWGYFGDPDEGAIGFETPRNPPDLWVDLPAPDAPLHEHLAFVGRVAEGLGVDGGLIDWNRKTGHGAVTWPYQKTCEAHDISFAALLAALVALESR